MPVDPKHLCRKVRGPPRPGTRKLELLSRFVTEGTVEVGSISETVSLSLSAGTFLLRWQVLRPVTVACERPY